MADDFDLEGLAAYLHMELTKVRRMAERGKVPGRRQNGGWRFNAAEIHHWLEARIADADTQEATRIEGALTRDQESASDEGITIEALLDPHAIAVPLMARTKAAVINGMCELAAGTGMLWDPDRMADAVRQREEMFPTAIEGGMALLHPRRPMESILGGPMLAVGQTTRGIPFGCPSGGLTDLFFLILSVNDRQHLRTLARLGRILGMAGTVDELRDAETPEDLRAVFIAKETGLRDC
ncbi:MAG: PTS sugar transporter subunit IIA [Planctomycetota bacterium]